MSKFVCLTRRNCLVFLRDHASVFFALLSTMIVLILQGVFLGEMNVTSITKILQTYGGERDVVLDEENARHLVQYWTLAGILVVNAVTVTLTVIGRMVSDTDEDRLESFYAAPVGKGTIALSYVSAAVLVGTLFCLITLAVAEVYIVATGGFLLSVAELTKIIVYIVMNVCIVAIIMYLVALFVKTVSAWSGMATIVGTLVGFVGAIYLPMGALPEGVANVLKFTPILHGASLMRKVCCADALATCFEGIPTEVLDVYQEEMGITVVMKDAVVGNSTQIMLLLAFGIVALCGCIIIARKRNIADR